MTCVCILPPNPLHSLLPVPICFDVHLHIRPSGRVAPVSLFSSFVRSSPSTMLGTPGSTPVQDIPPAAVADSGRPVSIPADVHHRDEKDGRTPNHPNSKDWGFIERLERRPSFLENLADSRDSQFQPQNFNELQRYFVRVDPPGRTLRTNKQWQARADRQDLFDSTDPAI